MIKALNWTYTLTEAEQKQVKEHSRALAASKTTIWGVCEEDVEYFARLGKAAEIAAYHFLCSLGFNATYPDMLIYKENQKSHSPDIVIRSGEQTQACHVKACDKFVHPRYLTSWAFNPYSLKHYQPEDRFIFVKRTGWARYEVCWTGKIESVLSEMGAPYDPRRKSTHRFVYEERLLTLAAENVYQNRNASRDDGASNCHHPQ